MGERTKDNANQRSVANDPHDLERFVQAQKDIYKYALAEVRAGRKESHWMWFIFPQFDGLGFTSTSRRYSIRTVSTGRPAGGITGARLRNGRFRGLPGGERAMDQPSDISRLLTLRKVTRAVAELLGDELRTHMATLAPLLRPRDVLGRHLRGNEKQPVRGDTEAFEELRSLYQELAGKGTWSLPKTLESPVDILHAPLELVPAEYAYEIGGTQPSKTVWVVSPLTWVLAYSGFGPRRLRELLAGARTSATRDLQECIVQFLVLHLTLSRRPAVIRLLESLRFPLSLRSDEEFEGLPVYTVSGPISTLRPADEVILQGTELSGTDVFEEVVNLDDLAQLRDPLRDRLAELVPPDT